MPVWCTERLKTHSPRAGARALVLAPTRELALQTCKVVKELGRFTNLRTAILVGGDSMEAQFAELAANPDIIVSTPGPPASHAFSAACTLTSRLTLDQHEESDFSPSSPKNMASFSNLEASNVARRAPNAPPPGG